MCCHDRTNCNYSWSNGFSSFSDLHRSRRQKSINNPTMFPFRFFLLLLLLLLRLLFDLSTGISEHQWRMTKGKGKTKRKRRLIKLLHTPIEEAARKRTENSCTTGCTDAEDDDDVWHKVSEGSFMCHRLTFSRRIKAGRSTIELISRSVISISTVRRTIHRLVAWIVCVHIPCRRYHRCSTFASPSSTEFNAWDRQHLYDKCVCMCAPVDYLRIFFSHSFVDA